MKEITEGLMLFVGLLLAGSEGPLFPLVNLVGLGLIGGFAFLVGGLGPRQRRGIYGGRS